MIRVDRYYMFYKCLIFALFWLFSRTFLHNIKIYYILSYNLKNMSNFLNSFNLLLDLLEHLLDFPFGIGELLKNRLCSWHCRTHFLLESISRKLILNRITISHSSSFDPWHLHAEKHSHHKNGIRIKWYLFAGISKIERFYNWSIKVFHVLGS